MDETGCFIGVNKSTHIVVPKSIKQAYINDPQNREWVTLIEAVSGAGVSIPSYIILTGKVSDPARRVGTSARRMFCPVGLTEGIAYLCPRSPTHFAL